MSFSTQKPQSFVRLYSRELIPASDVYKRQGLLCSKLAI